MKAAIVCGSRYYSPELSQHMPRVMREHAPELIIQGGARGADSVAAHYAREFGIPCIKVEADWASHGGRAGPMRNREMLRRLMTYGTDVAVIAFPGGIGTAGMVNMAKKARVKVISVTYESHEVPQ